MQIINKQVSQHANNKKTKKQALTWMRVRISLPCSPSPALQKLFDRTNQLICYYFGFEFVKKPTDQRQSRIICCMQTFPSLTFASQVHNLYFYMFHNRLAILLWIKQTSISSICFQYACTCYREQCLVSKLCPKAVGCLLCCCTFEI